MAAAVLPRHASRASMAAAGSSGTQTRVTSERSVPSGASARAVATSHAVRCEANNASVSVAQACCTEFETSRWLEPALLEEAEEEEAAMAGNTGVSSGAVAKQMEPLWRTSNLMQRNTSMRDLRAHGS